MTAAWAKLRKDYRGATFAECLRWAWARAKAMAALVARGPALLKVELAEVARRVKSLGRCSGSPAFVRSMQAQRCTLARPERWLRLALAFHTAG